MGKRVRVSSLNKEVRREGKGKFSYLEDRELRAKV